MHQYKKQLAATDAIISVARAIFLRIPISALNYLAEILTPKQPRRWVFLTQNSEFTGNSYYLFEHLQNTPNNIDARLIIYDRSLATKLTSQYGEAIVSYAWSWRAVKFFFTANVAIISYGMVVNAFFPFVLLRRCKAVVNLWHGVPLKRLGDQARHSFERQRRAERQRYSKMIASSKFEQLAYACCFNMSIDDIWITGVPRNDILCRESAPNDQAWPGGSTAKYILYAPTWRDNASDAQIFPFSDVELVQLNTLLEELDAYIIVRFHYIERGTYMATSPRILLDDGSALGEVQTILWRVDALITDYSSIYFDYLLRDRPIIFIPYDVEKYVHQRGFMLDYEHFTPGPKVKDWSDFLAEVRRAIEEPDAYAADRARVRAYVHHYRDGFASRRIVSEIERAVAAKVDRTSRVVTKK